MKKYLLIPTGFKPSSARNNWISDSGLHSSPSMRSLVDVDIVIVSLNTRIHEGRRNASESGDI